MNGEVSFDLWSAHPLTRRSLAIANNRANIAIVAFLRKLLKRLAMIFVMRWRAINIIEFIHSLDSVGVRIVFEFDAQ